MVVLLVLKESLKSIYGRYAAFVCALIKFFLALAVLCLLNQNLGFMKELGNPAVIFGIALACAFLPYSAISLVMAGVMLAHFYVVSFEMTLITGIFLVIVALLYYGFQPEDSYWLILTPLAFAFKVPYVIPILAGLSGGLLAVMPISCGAVVYYIIQYVKQNAGVLTNDASEDITQRYVQLIRSFIGNRTIGVFVVACAVGVLLVYLVRMLSVDYAWVLAIIAGILGQLTVIMAGNFVFGVSVPLLEMTIGIVISLILAGLYHFFVFAVDYNRTEYLQYEDDDYVYYVKAVPKVVVSKPDVQVQRMNNPKRSRRER